MTNNRTSEAVDKLIVDLRLMTKKYGDDIERWTHWKEAVAMAEVYKRMEEDLQSIGNITQDEKIKNFVQETLDFDPLSS